MAAVFCFVVVMFLVSFHVRVTFGGFRWFFLSVFVVVAIIACVVLCLCSWCLISLFDKISIGGCGLWNGRLGGS